MGNIVQSSTFPKIILCAQTEMYFRTNSLVNISLKDQTIKIFKGGLLSSNTYFNSVSIGKLKKYTLISDLSFQIIFSGYAKLTWKVRSLQGKELVLQEDVLQSVDLTTIDVPLPFWQDLQEGMLFFEIQGLDDSQIHFFTYLTQSLPLRQIRLGIVITHFNQQKSVLSAVERLRKELLNDDFFYPKVSICIVDNSRNLPEIEGVEVLKSPNLGGSGGFSRGLIHFRQQVDHTHCLFMDDDASCEIESIRRTLFYLAYVKDENTAISGAMLREVVPYMQHENGGVFDGLCRSVKCYYNLLDIETILLNEVEERVDYGAWWFFAFPIAKVRYLSFPYFVRGDDIGFSLANRFNILTINGIASWQADFSYKAAPLQLYLDQRNHVMHFLHGLVVGGNNKMFLKTVLVLFVLNALTCQYESARACTMALQDILKGTDFWRDNIDMQCKRKELTSITQIEKIKSIPVDLKKSAVKVNPEENKIIKIIRILTLNGHLVPNIFFHKQPVWQYKHYGVRLREIFLRKQAIYFVDDQKEMGIVLEHSKKKFFSYTAKHLWAVAKLFWHAKRLRREYMSSYSELTSEDFWQTQFSRTDI